MRRFLSKEFILFALVGVSNTGINFIVYTILVTIKYTLFACECDRLWSWHDQ